MKPLKINSIRKLREDKVYDIHHKLDSKEFLDNHPNLIANGKVISNCSRHAGGVLIADDLNEHMPIISSGGVRQSPWAEGQNVRHLEPLGFIKFDLLGLSTLRMIEGAIRHILVRHHNMPEPTFKDVQDFYNKHLHPDVIDFDDQEVYKNVFQKGNFAGIFQFTEARAQEFCANAQPKSLVDISAITSIYRPGPLSANVHEQYIQAKENADEIDYMNDHIKEVTQETYGFLIFQEQIALLAHKLGKGVSLDEGNLLRKVLTKKGTGKGHEVKMKIHDKFVEGCVEKGIRRHEAESMWERFEYFSGYGFNKCLSFSELVAIYNKEGEKIADKQIKDIKPGEFVRSRDEASGKDIFIPVKENHHNGKKKAFKFTLDDGRKIECTMDHKFRTECGKMLPIRDILEQGLDIVVSVEENTKQEAV